MNVCQGSVSDPEDQIELCRTEKHMLPGVMDALLGGTGHQHSGHHSS